MPGDPMASELFGARARIRLRALQHNLERIRSDLPDACVMAVVKANAYGHGLEEVARALLGVNALAVARLPEAIRIRRAGIETPVVLLSGVATSTELDVCSKQGFEIVVHSPEQVTVLDEHVGEPLVCWLKVDTGMTRLGFSPVDARAVIDKLGQHPAVAELRLMTHFASADETENPFTRKQMERFAAVTRGFAGDVSFANSPGMLAWDFCADARQQLGFSGDLWIRPGVALYGISPFAHATGAELGLLPVMQFEAKVLAVKPLPRGARVGYHGTHVADEESCVGIIAAGYGDGYTRHFRSGTPVLLNGRRVPLIGRVSMDMIAVDLGPHAQDRPGDVATLWGDGLPVEEVAPYADAIPYELVCGIMNREASLTVR